MATYTQLDRGEPQGNTPTQNTKYDDLITKAPWVMSPVLTIATPVDEASPSTTTTKTTITIG